MSTIRVSDEMEIKSRRVGDVMVHEHFVDGALVETSVIPIDVDLDGLWLEVAREHGSEDGQAFREAAAEKKRSRRKKRR